MIKILIPVFLLLSINAAAQKNQFVITEDISRFWKAFDLVNKTPDSLECISIVQKEYIDPGTAGLRGIMQARGYTAEGYAAAIKKYPLFWKSIRSNTLKADVYAAEIEKGISQLKKIYPELKPASVYFTIGAFRTNGTTIDGKVLIGSEIAMADNKTVTGEFGKNLSHLPPYFSGNPINNIAFLNVHEYIHTQQKTTIGNSLLAQTIIEGTAEFIATKAMNTDSPNEQISFGRLNDNRIKVAYTKEMFSPVFDNWIWNSPDNEFKMRDLGYYVGYVICEKFYLNAKDKKQAIKTMINLDYNNEEELTKFVDGTHYFEKPVVVYKESFEKARPVVTLIGPFENGAQNVDPNTKIVTVYFSQPMSRRSADFDIGPLGDKNVMWLQKRIGFSDDNLSYSFEIRPLEAGKRYQLLVNEAFMNSDGIPLKAYLIDITTGK